MSAKVRKTIACIPDASTRTLTLAQDIEVLKALTAAIRVSPEVRTYLHNVIVFMRMHRAVAGGISAIATRHLNQLVKYAEPAIYSILASGTSPADLTPGLLRRCTTSRTCHHRWLHLPPVRCIRIELSSRRQRMSAACSGAATSML